MYVLSSFTISPTPSSHSLLSLPPFTPSSHSLLSLPPLAPITPITILELKQRYSSIIKGTHQQWSITLSQQARTRTALGTPVAVKLVLVPLLLLSLSLVLPFIIIILITFDIFLLFVII